MSINLILPFLSTAIMFVFVVFVFRKYLARRSRLEFFYWGVGLTMFGLGSFAEAYLAISWNKWIFYIWYLFGAALNAAWLGHGTLYLMAKKKWRKVMTVLLTVGSFVAAYIILQAMPTWDESVFTPEKEISVQYGSSVEIVGLDEDGVIPSDVELVTVSCAETDDLFSSIKRTVDRTCEGNEGLTEVTYYIREGVIPLGSSMRLTTPLFNTYGLVFLVGGAIYSSYLFWRKRVLPNRVVANVLIAFGAILIGYASALARAGQGEYLYLAELLSAIIMFQGFLMAGKPQPNEEPAPVAAASATD